jgi:serine/threonine protein kinase
MPWDAPTPELLDLLVEWEDRRAAGRAADAETLCAGQPERADEVRAAVAHLAKVDAVLADDTAEAEAIPVVRGFRIYGWLGGGGMGDVYLAHDLALDRPVAVKIPKRTCRTVARARFEREGRTLAQLRHADIVPVFAAGVTDADIPYLVMDYIPGGTLADRLGDGPLPPAEAARVLIRVARAMHHAHQKGIVHRDLKPSNILFAADGSPLVGDFGVAAVLAGEPVATGPTADRRPADPRLTATDWVVGTRAYCAPELFRGDASPPDPAADVWALGVVLYQAVTGELPFDTADEAELKRAVASGEYTAPHVWNAAVPPEFSAVIGHCLTADPARRYASAETVAAALVAWQRRARAKTWSRWVATGVAALAVLAAGTGFALSQSATDSSERQAASPSFQSLTAQELRAEDDLRVATGIREQGKVTLRPDLAASLVNPHAVTRAAAQGGGTTFTAQGIALLPLAATPHLRNYEFRARVRQFQGLDATVAGLYFCHTPHAGEAHEVASLQFADYGQLSRQNVGPGGVIGNEAVLAHLWYRPPDLTAPNPAASERIISWFSNDVKLWHPQSPDPWWAAPTHDLAVRVEADKDWLQLTFDGKTAGMPLSKLKRHLGTVNGKPATIDPVGGFGVYLNACSITVSDCTLTAIKPTP